MKAQKILNAGGVTVLADSREANSLISRYISELGAKVINQNLEVGDYICSERVALERKSVASDTPVVIKTKKGEEVVTIKDAFKMFRSGKKMKVMGIDMENHEINWFNAYQVTRHKSKDLYGISFSPNRKRRNNEMKFDVKITSGHNIYALKNKKIVCIPTNILKEGDYVLIVPPKFQNRDPNLYTSFKKYLEHVQAKSTKGFRISGSKFKLNSAPRRYNIPVFDDNMFFVLGLWLADGHILPSGVKISQKDEDRNAIIEEHIGNAAGMFSKTSNVYSFGGKAYSAIFNEIFEGKMGSGQKMIPAFVYNSPNNLKASFIKGYLFGDGWVNRDHKRKNPQIKVISKSRMLPVGLSYLLYSLGIKNTITEAYKKYKGRKRKYYELSIKTGSIRRFLNIIGQIPSKEIKVNKSVSSIVPFHAKRNFYKPLLRLNKKDLGDFYSMVKELKIAYDNLKSYIEEFKNIVKPYATKKDFARKYKLNYSTLRNITNGYVKNPAICLEIINIIRKEKSIRPLKIDFKKLGKLLKKLNIRTYINARHYRELLPKKQPKSLIINVYKAIEKKIGIDSLFLLFKMYRREIFLERIGRIEKIPGEHDVYDFSVERAENFVGGFVPVLLHNTVKDFLQSITDQRIFEQLCNLKESYECPVLLIEGNPEMLFLESRMHENSIRGVLAHIAVDAKIPIIWTQNSRESAAQIFWMAKREQLLERKGIQTRSCKRAATPAKHQEFLVAGLPHVNTVLSQRLLKKFKTVRKVFNARPERLRKVQGLGEKKAKNIWELLNKDYSEKD